MEKAKKIKRINNSLSSAYIFLLIFWIVAYGAGYAQPSCCMDAVDRCQATFKCQTAFKETAGKIPCGLPCIPSHRSKAPPLNGFSSADASIRHNASMPCCVNVPCYDTSQAVYVASINPEMPPLSGIKLFYEIASLNLHSPFAAQKVDIVLQPPVPLYIQKSSFLC
jgi:hypothetical protein